jgi:hypothetical protein
MDYKGNTRNWWKFSCGIVSGGWQGRNYNDRVYPQSVLSHVMRFEFSSQRAVIVNLSRVRGCSYSLLNDLTIVSGLTPN